MLAELMRLKFGIAIAGTHGKTTTTSIVATILTHAGLDPDRGGRRQAQRAGHQRQAGAGAVPGRGGRRVGRLVPAPHADHRRRHQHRSRAPRSLHRPLDEIRETFVDFANRIPFYGLAVLCLDHPERAGPSAAGREAAW
jgi:UDP-N-acetylmuramate--alanine ligase